MSLHFIRIDPGPTPRPRVNALQSWRWCLGRLECFMGISGEDAMVLPRKLPVLLFLPSLWKWRMAVFERELLFGGGPIVQFHDYGRNCPFNKAINTYAYWNVLPKEFGISLHVQWSSLLVVCWCLLNNFIWVWIVSIVQCVLSNGPCFSFSVW